jgi:hypothetical protein
MESVMGKQGKVIQRNHGKQARIFRKICLKNWQLKASD